MRINLSGKAALVTGAGSGIGAACARALTEAGAFVWVNDLTPEQANPVAAEVDGSPLAGDVAEPGDWLSPVLGGPLHILVHNAGYDLATRVGQTNRQDFDRILRVMVTGPFDMTQHLLPALKNAKGACVIHIASIHATCTTDEMSAYAGAKGALVSMVKSMCQDLGPHSIRVLALSPGYVETPLMDAWVETTPDPAATRSHANDLHPLGRIGRPEDIAAFVTFLASPLAEFVNGVNLIIDGGLTARQVY